MFNLIMITPMKDYYTPNEVWAGKFPTEAAAIAAAEKRIEECTGQYYSYKVVPISVQTFSPVEE